MMPGPTRSLATALALAAAMMLTGIAAAAAQSNSSVWGPTPGSAQSANPFGPVPGTAPASSPFGPVPGRAAPAPSSPFGPAPGQAAPAGASPFGAPPNNAQAICSKFPALRDATEKAGKSIEAAGKRKAPPDVLCKAFRHYVAVEGRMIKFLQDNQSTCRVPDKIIKQARAGHAKALDIRTKVCAAAAAPRPQGPSLSDALSTPVVPSASNTNTGRGTYDTLTGNALAR